MFKLADPVGNILRRAAHLARDESYSPKGGGSVMNPDTIQFSVSGLLERANLRRTQSGITPLVPRDAPPLVEAKRRVCAIVGHPHLDGWEIAERPDVARIREVFVEAAG